MGAGDGAPEVLRGARAGAALRHGGPALGPVGAPGVALEIRRRGWGGGAREDAPLNEGAVTSGGKTPLSHGTALPGPWAQWVTQGRPHRHPVPGSCGSPRG